jgi:hypothetical protein
MLLLSLAVVALLSSPWSAAQQAAAPSLKLTIERPSRDPRAFLVLLQNTGSEPLRLYLGATYAGTQWNTAIHLVLTDSRGKTTELSRAIPAEWERYAAVEEGPRLMPEESLGVFLNLSDYSMNEKVRLSPAPGVYTLRAVYVGEAPRADAASRSWKGRVVSNDIEVAIP